MDSQAEIKTVCAGLERLPQDAKGLIIKYMAFLEKEGYKDDSAYVDLLKSLIRMDGANLLDPEDIKAKIARHRSKDRQGNEKPWTNSTKMLACYAYSAFCQMENIQWKPPHYRQDEANIVFPDEKDLNVFISDASTRMATFYLCLKETFADPGEILRAEWIDLKDDVLAINHPVKGHLTGYCNLSANLVSMLNNLPKTDKRIFPMSYVTARSYHGKLRQRLAKKLENPKLLNIAFKSFRHWGGSMVAHYTNGNVLKTKAALRHKNVLNTMKYIHSVDFRVDEDFEETTAVTVEEIRALGKAGWTKYDESTINGQSVHFYRKPKRFGGSFGASLQ